MCNVRNERFYSCSMVYLKKTPRERVVLKLVDPDQNDVYITKYSV